MWLETVPSVFLSFLLTCAFIIACKKDAGPGGKNSIKGIVYFKNGVTGNNDPAALSTVYISYGTSETTSSFNQTILTDNDGNYTFAGLNKGSYFIKAGYTDANGFKYVTQGFGILIKNKKDEIQLNIVLE